ncbi:MAG: TlpA family protein disulfide reductase, partial [Actinobacteria bacterium]|nr:TlpA family protein disulfide reductase [Actinomycetota bacterium]
MTALADAPVDAVPPRPRRRLLRTALLLVVVVVAGLVLAARLGGPTPVRSVLLGKPAPALFGPTLDAGAFDLEQWRGQVVVVNVWASWCVPCQREQPLLVEAYRQLAPRGLQMVGINVRDRPQDAQAFRAKYGKAPWPSVVDPDGRHAIDWGTFALPETYVVDRDGTVVS